MEPARFVMFAEVPADEAEDFEQSLRMWLVAVGKPSKYAIRPVILTEDEDGQTSAGTGEKVAG